MKDAASKLSAPTRTRVKICGLTREQDVEAAVEAGADAVGFVLYAKSPRAVSAQRAAELARRLPPFVTPVLLFVNEDATKAIAALAGVAGAAAQFHGDETPEQCWAASGEGRFRYLRAGLLFANRGEGGAAAQCLQKCPASHGFTLYITSPMSAGLRHGR